ncbi:unnamed protein product [Adineta ricciae]|uniref:Uncharacterized protein n=1 Tax=Adineta ricciae TaxID=249248 RepID=A0A816BCG5_ADIRI|nr:unnamed protein product [Adineta ricciae]
MDKKDDKHGEDKEDNFFVKTAYTIRAKLRLTRKKRERDAKSKAASIDKTDSATSSADDDDPSKSTLSTFSPAGNQNNNTCDIDKDKNPAAKDSVAKAANKKRTPTADQATSELKNNDTVHLSFHGIQTVGDLLDRIDEVIEGAKIIIEGNTGNTSLTIQDNAPRPRPPPSSADLDKKQPDKSEGSTEKSLAEASDQEGKENDEPIRIDYNEIHTIEDLLARVYKQPGSRKVILENAPDDDESVLIETKTSSTEPADPPTTSNDNDESSGPPKSILKTSQDPSSLDTSTKVSSFQDDQIHVNIEGVQSVNELLDRVDEAVQSVPVVLKKTNTQGKPESSLPDEKQQSERTVTDTDLPLSTNEENKSASEKTNTF